MNEILEVNGGNVKIGGEDGKIVNLPIASLQFANPKVGDQVRVYRDGETVIVKRVEPNAGSTSVNVDDKRKVNKIAYILITFFLGGLGIHRFMRGQVGLGILMIFFGWLTLGVWWLVDFIISLVKLSAFPGDDYIFTPDGRFVK